MLILVGVLLGVALASAAIAPRDGGRDEPSSVTPFPGATPTPTPRPEAEPRRAPTGTVTSVQDVPGEPPLTQLDAGAADQAVQVEAGRRVRLAISSDETTSVQVGEDGPIEAIDPAAPARFDLSYERPMTVPIRDVDSGRTIGELQVVAAEPAG
jgi:hypothetical protein